jgi:hypothetical protein
MQTGDSLPAAHDRRSARSHDDSQLRYIEELVARLRLVNMHLSHPVRPEPARSPHDSGQPDDARRSTDFPGPDARDAGPAAA